MKRISLLVIVLLTVVSDVYGIRTYCPVRYRTRWSVYKHGLISGDVYYSPYAYQFGHTGLVPGNVRYSPYAFDAEHSGLIYEPWCGSFGYLFFHHYDVNRDSYYINRNLNWSRSSSGNTYSKSYRKPEVCYEDRMERYNSTTSGSAANRVSMARSIESSEQFARDRQQDGDSIISQYLKSKNIEFQLDNFLRIDGRTVSVNFMLKDRNMIIKYWDPEQINLLESKVEYKRMNYVQYLQSWNDFWSRYLQAGGKVCQIISVDRNEIISELERSSELNAG